MTASLLLAISTGILVSHSLISMEVVLPRTYGSIVDTMPPWRDDSTYVAVIRALRTYPYASDDKLTQQQADSLKRYRENPFDSLRVHGNGTSWKRQPLSSSEVIHLLAWQVIADTSRSSNHFQRRVLVLAEYVNTHQGRRWAIAIVRAGQGRMVDSNLGIWHVPMYHGMRFRDVDSGHGKELGEVEFTTTSLLRRFGWKPTNADITQFLDDTRFYESYSFMPSYFGLEVGTVPAQTDYNVFVDGSVMQTNWQALIGESPIVYFPEPIER